jgi:hypothetical protein
MAMDGAIEVPAATETLGLTVSDLPTQSEVQALANMVDGLILALWR